MKDINKMTSKEKKKICRTRYILDQYESLEQLARDYSVPLTTFYYWKRNENWDMMKETTPKNILEVSGAHLELAYDSIEFWNEIKNYCKDRLKANKDAVKYNEKIIKEKMKREEEGCIVLAPDNDKRMMVEMDVKDVKGLAETYQIAEERVMILTTIKVSGED